LGLRIRSATVEASSQRSPNGYITGAFKDSLLWDDENILEMMMDEDRLDGNGHTNFGPSWLPILKHNTPGSDILVE
jgi:hypothetical protein